MSGVTSAQMAAAGSDDSGDSDFFNSSLSIWRGPRSSLEGEYEPVSLDLHTACSIGNFDVVRMYINSEEDLNAKNSGGYTPLMYAAYIGHDNVVNMLIDAQVDVNLSNNKGHTPLMLAASCGNESVCDFLMDAGADLEARDKKGWTALFHATFNGHQNLVKFLLERGANIDAVEPIYGFTPLMQAAFHDHEIIVQCLLQQGANMTKTSRVGDTARSLAMKKNFIKIVSLIDNKALSGVQLRMSANYGSDDSSSDDSTTLGRARTHRVKRLNINDGPQAMSKIKHHSHKASSVTFKDPVCTERDTHGSSQQDVRPILSTSVIGPLRALHVASSENDMKPFPPKKALPQASPYKVAPQAQGIAKVMQVSPTPKMSPPGRPVNLHELLVQLGLPQYEEKFVEQDIDLEVFLTLSADDLKDIGLDKFGPRRKMTNAIESWHRENGFPRYDIGLDNTSLTSRVEKLQQELKEVTFQLNQTYTQLHHYHKELEHEKNIRSETESYLLAEKVRINNFIAQSKDIRIQCSKALKSHGKVKTIQQLLRSRHEGGADAGFIPLHLQDTLKLTDDATKKQVTVLANMSTSELWDSLQTTLTEGSKSINMAILNLDQVGTDRQTNY